MNIALWIVQVLLAFAFFMAGAFKTFTPNEELIAGGMTWVAAVPSFLPKVAGVAEILGAIGLIVPALTRIKPSLTALAAAGLVLVMVPAALLHVSLGEWAMLPSNLVLGGLAAFVAWGRYKARPIAERSAATAATA